MEREEPLEKLLTDDEFPNGVIFTTLNKVISIPTALEGSRFSVFYFGS